MSPSIAVVGAGPGLGLAVARRYAEEGYTVVLVARREDRLRELRHQVTAEGGTVHILAADLSDDGAGARLAAGLRDLVGTPDVVYYAPGIRGYVPVAQLTSADLRDLMGVAVYTLVDLIHDLLPDMVGRGSGAILTASAPSAVTGMAQLAATAVLGAQRNYLQALQGAVTDRGIHVGRLYIGATIGNSAFHTQQQAARSAGEPTVDLPVVDPAHLAQLLLDMQTGRETHEVVYPPGPREG